MKNLLEYYEEIIKIDQDKINEFAQFSGDKNPIHIDKGFAKSQGFQKTISHGMIPISYLSSIMTKI